MARDRHNPARGSAAASMLLVVMVLFILLASGAAAARWLGSRQFDGRWQTAKAAGDPTTIDDVLGVELDPEDNAAHLLQQAGQLAKALGTLRANDPKSDLGISSALRLEEELLTLVRRAVAVPDYRSVAFSPPAEPRCCSVPPHRHLVRALINRVHASLGRGRTADALDSALLMLKVCRQLEREPTLIAYRAALANRFVALVEIHRMVRAQSLTADQRQRLDAELAAADAPDAFVAALKGERVVNREWYRRLPGRATNSVLGGTLGIADLVECFDLFEHQIETVDLPYLSVWERAAPTVGAFATRADWRSALNFGPEVVLPLLLQTRAAWDADRARLRCLRLLMALADRAETPADLAELGIAPAHCRDPFTGDLLSVVMTSGGWMVYSAGCNGVDDGGSLHDGRDIGLALDTNRQDLVVPRRRGR